MKRKTFILASLMGLLGQSAQATQVADTLVIEGVEKVKIETRDTVQRIVISGSKDDPFLHYIQRISIDDTSAVRRQLKSIKNFNKVTTTSTQRKKNTVAFGYQFMLGMGTMTGAPSGYSFKVWPSMEWSITPMLNWNPFGNKNVWHVGLGIGQRHYRMDDDTYWAKDTQGNMMLTPYASNQRHTQTSLTVFSVQLPLIYTHKFDAQGRWAVSVGGVVNLNTGAHATRKFKTGDEKYNVETTDIHQRLFTIDGLLMLKTPCFLPIYCKYSPTTFFKNDRGPKAHQLSFGIYL